MKYRGLVKKRRNDYLSSPGLINPSKLENNSHVDDCYLDPWAKWHNKIPTKILLVALFSPFVQISNYP
jgi:hypothetical protein